jgi:hypothetical protein
MLSMLISIESILYILLLEKYFFLKIYQYSPYLYVLHIDVQAALDGYGASTTA